MKKAIFATSLTLVFLATISAATAGGAKPPSMIQVTSMVQRLDTAGNPYALGSDRGNAGGSDSYQSYTTRTDWLNSVILGSQDWKLDGMATAKRKFWVSFDSPAPGGTPNLLPNDYVRGMFQTLCSNWGDTAALGGMAPGDTKTCGMIFNFSVDDNSSIDYRVAFQEKNLQPADANGNVIGTDGSDLVFITCTTADTDGKCNHWTIDPLVPAGSIGTLVQLTTVKGKMTLTPIGHYNYIFHIEIAK